MSLLLCSLEIEAWRGDSTWPESHLPEPENQVSRHRVPPPTWGRILAHRCQSLLTCFQRREFSWCCVCIGPRCPDVPTASPVLGAGLLAPAIWEDSAAGLLGPSVCPARIKEAEGNVETGSCHLTHEFTEDRRGDGSCQCHRTDYLLIWDHEAIFQQFVF